MGILSFLTSAAIFVFAVSCCMFLWFYIAESIFIKKRKAKRRLLYMSSSRWHGREKIASYRKKHLKESGIGVRLAFMMPQVPGIDRLIIASGTSLNPGLFLMISLVMGVVGGMAGLQFVPDKKMIFPIGIFLSFVPYLYLKAKERANLSKFDEQLPDALDLLSRALKSGHALTSGLAMISEEMDAPVKNEFGAVVDEINFGLTVKDALMNMCERIPLPDLKFLSLAILIQKETGGNLAEIVDNIGHLIRKRMQFKRHVQTLTAEGKFSAMVLILLPITMFVYLYTTQHEYVSLLWRDPLGKKMLIGGIFLQVIGAVVMKKMISIEA